jgi:hypothetical protein
MGDLPRAKRLCVAVRIEALKTPQELKCAGESLRRDAARAVHSELFPDVTSACLHFGLDVTGNHRNVRYHVNAYAKHLVPKVADFSGLSVTRCRLAECPCQPVELPDDDADSDEEADTPAQAEARQALAFGVIRDMIIEGIASDQKISDHVRDEFGFLRSRSAIQQDRLLGRTSLPAMGRRTVLSDASERKILDTMKYLRANKIGFFPQTIDSIARSVAAKAGITDFVFGRSWRRSFVKRHEEEIGMSNPSLHEDVRKRCCTSGKVARHYEILQETLLGLGWADVNADFDPDVPFDRARPNNSACCPIFIKAEFAGRIISMDETRFSLNQAKEQKLGKRKMVFCKSFGDWTDNREVGLNKSDIAASLVGGSGADTRALPCFCIFNGGFHPEELESFPRCEHRRDADGGALYSYGTSNEKGSMTDTLMLEWLNSVLPASFPDLSPDRPVLLICDGYGSHLSLPFLKRAVELGVVIVLRPPHTSHLTQGEDVEGGNFSTFHRKERVTKLEVKNGRELSDHRRSGAGYQLVRADIGNIICDAWLDAFSNSVNATAWQRIGVYPLFNRKVYWELKAEEDKNLAALNTVAPLRPSAAAQDALAAAIQVHEVAAAVFPPAEPRRQRANGSENCWHGGAVTAPEYIARREAMLLEKEAEEEGKRAAAATRERAANEKHRARFAAGLLLLPLLSAGTKRLADLTSNQIDEILAALGQQSCSTQTAKADKMLRLTDYMSSVDLQYPTPVAQVVVADIAAQQPPAGGEAAAAAAL